MTKRSNAQSNANTHPNTASDEPISWSKNTYLKIALEKNAKIKQYASLNSIDITFYLLKVSVGPLYRVSNSISTSNGTSVKFII